MIATQKTWSFEETRRMVRASYGEKQAKLVSPCLDSLVARQFYAAHHLHNFEQLVVDRLSGVPNGWSLERLLIPSSADEAAQNKRLSNCLAAEATACAASLHCLLDTLAHAVALSLGMNIGTDALAERQISLSNVVKRLSTPVARGGLAIALLTLNQSSDVAYLEALVNHSKHRSVIRPGFCFDAATDLQNFSVEFEAFKFKRDKHAPAGEYARREVKSSLEKAHGAISHWIVEVGCKLNDELARTATAS